MKKKMVVLKFSEKTWEMMEQLQKLSGAKSTEKTIAWALAFYECALLNEKEGCKILVEHPNGSVSGIEVRP